MLESSDNVKIMATNRKALHDYFILQEYEAGIELFGTEIKSIRNGKANLKDSFCCSENGEMFVIGMHISPYEQGNIFNRDPLRKRRLLLHRREINYLSQESVKKGLSIIPLQIYIKDGRAKLDIALCRGKKLYDKRAVAAQKEAQRNIDRSLKEQFR